MNLNIKKLFAPQDMTQGSILQKITLFAIPMVIGNIAQQLYSTVDSIVVGNYIGDNALASVGSSMPILNLLLVLFVGISVGTTIAVSQYFGAQNREKLSKAVGTCVTLIGIGSIIVMLVGTTLTEVLLVALKTPEVLIEDAATYLNVSVLMIAGMAYYNILSGVLRGLGDSFSALLYLLVATVLNIVLDVYFVAVLGWGIAGVAIATGLAQLVSSILCFIKLSQMTDVFDFKLKYLKLDSEITRQTIKLGLPSGLTQAIFSLGMIAVQSLTNTFGETFITANIIVMRIDGFAIMPAMSFGNATTTFAGQNVGANKMHRVKEGAKKGTLLSVGVSFVLTALILILSDDLMRLFTKTELIISLSTQLISILAIGYLAFPITQSLSGIMRGAGDTMTPMWISIATMFLFRVPFAYLFVHLTKTEAMPLGNPMVLYYTLVGSWVLGAIITAIAYKRGKWQRSSIVNYDR